MMIELLDEIRAAFSKYVVFPSPEALDATVLWCAATHAQPAWEHAPRLAVLSPEKRCGKSRLMDVAEVVCYQPLVTINTSTAALVRSITEDDPPTIMVDEADTIFGNKKTAENNEDIRGILNAGHQRNRPYLRWNMTGRSAEQCPTFAMVMLAGLGKLPDTIMDRAIVIRMRRRGPNEKVKPFRTRRDAQPLQGLRDKVNAWATENIGTLQDAEPDMPVEDRAADTWEPLFVIAHLAGGDWPERAEQACLALTSEDPDDDHEGTRLLADLKLIWPESETSLHTIEILRRLHQLEESPWEQWGHKGEPLNAENMAALLKPYGVKSTNVRLDGAQRKGYHRNDLVDAWRRYVVPDGPSRDGGGTASHWQTRPDADKGKQSNGMGGTGWDAWAHKHGRPRPRPKVR
jgi:hypothetical protein